jgi:hypothetical protein
MKFRSIIETAVAASISTSSIATPPGAEVSRKSRARRKVIRRPIPTITKGIAESAVIRLDTSTAILFEDETTDELRKTIDSTNTKIDNAVKQGQVADDSDYQTTTFGLQDADGNIVRVKVKREQANEFESQLNTMLSDTDNQKEIAEILYILKSDFDIVDVDWAEPITEDDEPEGEDGGEFDPEGDQQGLELGGEQEDGEPSDGEDDLDLSLDDEEGIDGADDPAADIDLQKSTVELLQQVIDLLKKETELRSTEAESQTVDIEQEKQEKEIAMQQEIADMEKHEEKQREGQKHEKLLQRLAKFRSMKQTGEV